MARCNSPRPTFAVATLALAASLAAATAWPASLEKALVLAGMEGRALDRARSRALALVERGACRQVFSDFKDAEGRTLQEKLDELGLGDNPPQSTEITARVL